MTKHTVVLSGPSRSAPGLTLVVTKGDELVFTGTDDSPPAAIRITRGGKVHTVAAVSELKFLTLTEHDGTARTWTAGLKTDEVAQGMTIAECTIETCIEQRDQTGSRNSYREGPTGTEHTVWGTVNLVPRQRITVAMSVFSPGILLSFAAFGNGLSSQVQYSKVLFWLSGVATVLAILAEASLLILSSLVWWRRAIRIGFVYSLLMLAMGVEAYLHVQQIYVATDAPRVVNHFAPVGTAMYVLSPEFDGAQALLAATGVRVSRVQAMHRCNTVRSNLHLSDTTRVLECADRWATISSELQLALGLTVGPRQSADHPRIRGECLDLSPFGCEVMRSNTTAFGPTLGTEFGMMMPDQSEDHFDENVWRPSVRGKLFFDATTQQIVRVSTVADVHRYTVNVWGNLAIDALRTKVVAVNSDGFVGSPASMHWAVGQTPRTKSHTTFTVRTLSHGTGSVQFELLMVGGERVTANCETPEQTQLDVLQVDPSVVALVRASGAREMHLELGHSLIALCSEPVVAPNYYLELRASSYAALRDGSANLRPLQQTVFPHNVRMITVGFEGLQGANRFRLEATCNATGGSIADTRRLLAVSLSAASTLRVSAPFELYAVRGQERIGSFGMFNPNEPPVGVLCLASPLESAIAGWPYELRAQQITVEGTRGGTWGIEAPHGNGIAQLVLAQP